MDLGRSAKVAWACTYAQSSTYFGTRRPNKKSSVDFRVLLITAFQGHFLFIFLLNLEHPNPSHDVNGVAGVLTPLCQTPRFHSACCHFLPLS